MEYLSVSDAARELGAKPKQISDLLYQRELRDDLCPIVAGRRLIPRSYLPAVLQALIKRDLVKIPLSPPAIGTSAQGGGAC